MKESQSLFKIFDLLEDLSKAVGIQPESLLLYSKMIYNDYQKISNNIPLISPKLLIQEVMILQFKVTSLEKKVGELGHTNKTILQELRDLKTFMMPSSMLQNNENSSSSSSALQSLNSAETQVINLIITNPNPESFPDNIKNLDILTVITR